GDGDAEVHGPGAGADDGDGLRVELGGEDDGGPLLHGPAHEQDRLGDGGGLSAEGGVGDAETGGVLDGLQEGAQRPEPAPGGGGRAGADPGGSRGGGGCRRGAGRGSRRGCGG